MIRALALALLVLAGPASASRDRVTEDGRIVVGHYGAIPTRIESIFPASTLHAFEESDSVTFSYTNPNPIGTDGVDLGPRRLSGYQVNHLKDLLLNPEHYLVDVHLKAEIDGEVIVRIWQDEWVTTLRIDDNAFRIRGAGSGWPVAIGGRLALLFSAVFPEVRFSGDNSSRDRHIMWWCALAENDSSN